jgi:MFS family permease
VLLGRDAPPRTVMILGSLALAVGGAVTLVALTLSSPVVFFVGAAVAGVGFGGGFQGALRTVLPLAAPHQRAGVLSIIYVVSYLGLGVPAVWSSPWPPWLFSVPPDDIRGDQ